MSRSRGWSNGVLVTGCGGISGVSITRCGIGFSTTGLGHRCLSHGVGHLCLDNEVGHLCLGDVVGASVS